MWMCVCSDGCPALADLGRDTVDVRSCLADWALSHSAVGVPTMNLCDALGDLAVPVLYLPPTGIARERCSEELRRLAPEGVLSGDVTQ